MKPNQKITSLTGGQAAKGAIVRFFEPAYKEQGFPEPYGEMMEGALRVLPTKNKSMGDQIKIGKIAQWLTDDGSSIMDLLPDFCHISEEDDGIYIRVDIGAVKASGLAHRAKEMNEPVPIGKEWVIFDEKLYKNTSPSWELYG